ncbi:ECF-type sigma factor [uncultured Rubinisphaera sp.]|uniref:ECF-type sigma factor n=1 Tax=uncultured Rubinisphaera sp. TaxID=1678686 RepID=UPI0030DAA9ED|tara:strand:+ start:58 stop:618 length:561 start_codon:yes stop_codon:yes gene_type:complete
MSNDVTIVLQNMEAGTASFEDDLIPLIYSELRRIAQSRLSREAIGHTLQATALVNEYFLNVSNADPELLSWENRRHFYSAAARAMQNILVDHARRKKSDKRGGDNQKLSLENHEQFVAEKSIDLIALDEALQKLETKNQRVAETVRLKYFANMTISEIANHLTVSAVTVERDWAYAKAWLMLELQD